MVQILSDSILINDVYLFFCIYFFVFFFLLQDYLHLAIKDGAIVATSNLGGGSKDVRVVPFTSAAAASRSLRFNDNEWHYVVLHRRLTTVRKCHEVMLMHAP